MRIVHHPNSFQKGNTINHRTFLVSPTISKAVKKAPLTNYHPIRNHHPVDICPESVNTIGIKLILLLFNYLIQLSNHFDTNTQHLRFVYLSIQILIIFYYEPIFRRIKTFLVNATAAFLLSESFWSPNPELFSVQSMCQLGRVLLKCHSNYFCRLAIFRLIYYQKRMSRPIKQLIEV